MSGPHIAGIEWPCGRDVLLGQRRALHLTLLKHVQPGPALLWLAAFGLNKEAATNELVDVGVGAEIGVCALALTPAVVRVCVGSS